MSRICLDTSAYSHFKRGHEPVVKLIRSARRVLVPIVAIGELRAGFAMGSRADQNDADLRTFLKQSVVAVLDVEDEAASLYAEIVAQLKRAGTPLPSNDIWIAALAAREGASVVTYDEHFRRIQRVGVQLLS